MKRMKRVQRKKAAGKPLFNSSEIVAKISESFLLDLADGPTANAVGEPAALYYRNIQEQSTLKKFFVPGKRESILASAAYDKFAEINEHMASYSYSSLELEEADDSSNRDFYYRVLRCAKNLCKQILTFCSEDEWFHFCRNSAGVSQGVPYSLTGPEGKFTYPITGNSRVERLSHRYLRFDPQLKRALEVFNVSRIDKVFEASDVSKATTVPKNDKTDRMIAIEPTWNMFFQQGLMAAMYQRLASFGLDVRTLPTKHRQLAQEASISGRLATIDFSSASDCLSYELVKWLLPHDWFSRIDLVRSSRMVINRRTVDLNMISTMGNAITFPLETLVFYSLAVSTVHCLLPNPWWSQSCLCNPWIHDHVSVFGDDTILPSFAVPAFLDVSKKVGLLVNNDKSFYEEKGGFRESCGGDFYHGVNVRPLFLKAPTSERLSAFEPWLYIMYNGLLKKYRNYFGTLTYLYERRVFRLFEDLCRDYDITVKVVPNDFPDDAGLKVGDDFSRFRECYSSLRFSKIAVNEHGQFTFNYCRFVYWSVVDSSYDLRYALWLKAHAFDKPWIMATDLRDVSDSKQDLILLGKNFAKLKLGLSPELLDLSHTRKRGGYVVAKASDYSFWDI